MNAFRFPVSRATVALVITGAVSLLIPVAPARAQVNLLVNPSFEAFDASAPPFFIRSSGNTPGWIQFGDGVDLIHNSYTQPPPIPVLVDASDGVQFLDMNQAFFLGGVEQVVSALTGVTYRLELDTAAWAQNSIGGTLGYQLFDPTSSAILAQGSFTDNVGGTWVLRSLDATAIGPQIGVRIQGLVDTQAGMGLDNVRLNAVNTAAPEPGALALLTSGIGIAGLALRRRTT